MYAIRNITLKKWVTKSKNSFNPYKGNVVRLYGRKSDVTQSLKRLIRRNLFGNKFEYNDFEICEIDISVVLPREEYTKNGEQWIIESNERKRLKQEVK